MEHHRPQHHSEWSHRSTTTTTTTIAGLSWPPLRSASFLKEGYSGLASSLCLDFDPLWWSTHQVRAHGGGTGKAPITLATIHKRLSAAAPPVPPFSRRKENSSFRSGELQAPSRSGPTVLPAGNDAVTTVASAANGTAGRPSFDATVLGLGELRTAAHTNAKQPLYNFLARCRSPGRRVGDAEYWRRAVWAWCAEENLRPVDLSTKQVSLYLRQMAQDPKISSYYGVSKIDEGTGALRFALEGRPYDWSHFHRDERSKARLAGWTCAAAGEDTGRRTFASCGSGGASVKVQVGKPSYAQVCELEAVLVNGVDFTSLAVFQPARELGRFADPEGLRKMLAAVSPVSLCAGIRLEAAGPSAVAGFADFRALFRGLTDASPSVSARVEVVGGDAVCRSSKCYRVLAAGAGSGSGSFEAEKSGDAARVRRCEACTHYLNSVLLPRVREEAADVAATGGGSGGGSGSDSDSGVSEKRRVVIAREAEAGTKRRIGGSRGNSTAYEETTHQQPKAGWVDEGRREGSPQAVTGTKRQEASAEGSRPATKGVSVGQKAGVTVWRADDGSARKRFKKRACSGPTPESSSSTRRHPPAGGGDILRAALGLSTLRTIPRHRWALNNSERRKSLAC